MVAQISKVSNLLHPRGDSETMELGGLVFIFTPFAYLFLSALVWLYLGFCKCVSFFIANFLNIGILVVWLATILIFVIIFFI